MENKNNEGVLSENTNIDVQNRKSNWLLLKSPEPTKNLKIYVKEFKSKQSTFEIAPKGS